MPGRLVLDKETGYFKGNYSDLHLQCKLALEPIRDKEKRGPDSNLPSHNAYVDIGGGMVMVGAAWTKNGKPNGRLAGKMFLTISLDDPSFPRALNLWAFPDAKGEEFEVSWKRERASDAQQAAA